MNKFVITIARETGSGGHNITKKLSEALGVPYYDRDLLRKASEVSGIHERLFGEADERIGFKEMISAAEKLYTEESCIIHGRCGNFLLQGRPDVLRVFIHAPLEARRDRVAAFSLAWSEREILRHIRVEDKRRAAYYHYYTGEDWRDAAGYDLCLDSSLLGEDGCVERILQVLPFYT